MCLQIVLEVHPVCSISQWPPNAAKSEPVSSAALQALLMA